MSCELPETQIDLREAAHASTRPLCKRFYEIKYYDTFICEPICLALKDQKIILCRPRLLDSAGQKKKSFFNTLLFMLETCLQFTKLASGRWQKYVIYNLFLHLTFCPL